MDNRLNPLETSKVAWPKPHHEFAFPGWCKNRGLEPNAVSLSFFLASVGKKGDRQDIHQQNQQNSLTALPLQALKQDYYVREGMILRKMPELPWETSKELLFMKWCDNRGLTPDNESRQLFWNPDTRGSIKPLPRQGSLTSERFNVALLAHSPRFNPYELLPSFRSTMRGLARHFPPYESAGDQLPKRRYLADLTLPVGIHVGEEEKKPDDSLEEDCDVQLKNHANEGDESLKEDKVTRMESHVDEGEEGRAEDGDFQMADYAD
jgi:hypothetical protein